MNKAAILGHSWHIQDKLTSTQLHVLQALIDGCVDGKHYCAVSREHIARKCRISIRTVSRAFSHLKELGLITIKRRFNQSNIVSFCKIVERTPYHKKRKKNLPKFNGDTMSSLVGHDGTLTDDDLHHHKHCAAPDSQGAASTVGAKPDHARSSDAAAPHKDAPQHLTPAQREDLDRLNAAIKEAGDKAVEASLDRNEKDRQYWTGRHTRLSLLRQQKYPNIQNKVEPRISPKAAYASIMRQAKERSASDE